MKRAHWMVLALVAGLASLLPSCASFDQTPETALVRQPGKRIYGPPVPIEQEAKKHWEFALLSQSAYAQAAKDKEGPASPAPGSAVAAPPRDAATGADVMGDCRSSAKTLLLKAGWQRWSDFPDAELAEAVRKAQLRFEVWERREPAAVVIVFGGALFTSRDDWLANLRWFIPWHIDAYTQVVERLGPAFVRRYAERLMDPAAQHLRAAPLYAAGHSLGGSLAQQFAYALPQSSVVPRVRAVYAFDPSPVSGYFSVDPSRRDENQRHLAIDRIFERGELWAALRPLINFVVPPSAEHPTIRTVRYQLFYALNPIAGHAMGKLACRLYEASDHSIED
jgi:hypothetical protein